MFKSIFLAMLFAATVFPKSIRADESTLSTDRLRAAISKALPTLEAGSIGSANKRQCFTCHSQAVPVFAFVEAKRQGFSVDEENLKRQLQHTYDHLKRGLANYRQGKGQGGDVLTAGYALWTLDEGNWPVDEVTEAVSHYLLETQLELRHWRHRGSRPPTSGSDFTATYVALRALNHFGTEDQQEQIAERRKLVAEWLASAAPAETEDHVFRLSSLKYVDCDPNLIETASAALLKTQREDGGWGQKADMSSDAYATSTALSALLRDGNIPSSNKFIRKGIDFLLSTQRDDGTWQVTTRAKPVQEYFESDFPHGKDQFISIAATAWSTLALLQALPPTDAPKAAIEEPAAADPTDDMVSNLGDVDRLVQDFITKYEVPGASIAMTDKGNVVYSKGFGYADIDTHTSVQTNSLFRIASLSKPITAVAILQLGVPSPAGHREVIVAMLNQKLDFAPGERYAYSNFGYCLLGRVIETLTGTTYETYVQERVLRPIGIQSMHIGATRLDGRDAAEVRYYAPGHAKSVFQSNLGDEVPPPYGSWNLEAMDSHGGWIASAEDMAKFAASLDDLDNSPILSRESIERMHARPLGLAGYEEGGAIKDSFYSLGWLNRVTGHGQINHWHTGSLPGTSAIMIRRHDGRNMVALLNTRDSQQSENLGKAIDRLLHKAANAVERVETGGN